MDIITFGSPCQDMSIAGKRSGLDGSRSSLFYEAVRIIKEMRCATDGRYPRFAVWENVPGAFSSNRGEDFRCVLESLCQVKDETLTFFSLIYLRSFYWGYSPVSDYRLHLLPDRLNKKPNRFFRDFQKIFNLFILQKNSTEFLDALTYCRVRYTAPGSNRALFFFANKRFAQVF